MKNKGIAFIFSFVFLTLLAGQASAFSGDQSIPNKNKQNQKNHQQFKQQIRRQQEQIRHQRQEMKQHKQSKQEIKHHQQKIKHYRQKIKHYQQEEQQHNQINQQHQAQQENQSKQENNSSKNNLSLSKKSGSNKKLSHKFVVPIHTHQEVNNISVIFFFSYSCKQCYYWHKELQKIKPVLSQHNIKIYNQPIIYDKYSDFSAQIYYALKATHQLSLSNKVWEGLINDDWNLKSKKSLKTYVNNIGGNGKKLIKAINSSTVVKNLTLMTPLYTKEYHIKWPPNIVVSGRYAFSKATIKNNVKNIPKALQNAINLAKRAISKNKNQ